jgi:hypothetical protein
LGIYASFVVARERAGMSPDTAGMSAGMSAGMIARATLFTLAGEFLPRP